MIKEMTFRGRKIMISDFQDEDFQDKGKRNTFEIAVFFHPKRRSSQWLTTTINPKSHVIWISAPEGWEVKS